MVKPSAPVDGDVARVVVKLDGGVDGAAGVDLSELVQVVEDGAVSELEMRGGASVLDEHFGCRLLLLRSPSLLPRPRLARRFAPRPRPVQSHLPRIKLAHLRTKIPQIIRRNPAQKADIILRVERRHLVRAGEVGAVALHFLVEAVGED